MWFTCPFWVRKFIYCRFFYFGRFFCRTFATSQNFAANILLVNLHCNEISLILVDSVLILFARYVYNLSLLKNQKENEIICRGARMILMSFCYCLWLVAFPLLSLERKRTSTLVSPELWHMKAIFFSKLGYTKERNRENTWCWWN